VWKRGRDRGDEQIDPILGRWIMRMDAKLDEILDLLREDDDEPEADS
jgi:hypothetical protein